MVGPLDRFSQRGKILADLTLHLVTLGLVPVLNGAAIITAFAGVLAVVLLFGRPFGHVAPVSNLKGEDEP
jgi:hypothetical protein